MPGLPASVQVRRIQEAMKPWKFAVLHGAFIDSLAPDADQAVQRSADRYCGILDGSLQRNYF